MRAWMESHNGKHVETQQRDVITGSLWTPGPRVVDASRATRVRLGESLRYYEGMRVIKKTADRLIVADESHYIVYTTA